MYSCRGALVSIAVISLLALLGGPAFAQESLIEGTVPPTVFDCPDDGLTICTPPVLLELPTEIEVELGMDSLKQAALWNEIEGMLDEENFENLVPCDAPQDFDNGLCATAPRRESFTDNPMPQLRVWSPTHNPLTDEPYRLRPTDGEICWVVPGLLFDDTANEPVDSDLFLQGEIEALPDIGVIGEIVSNEDGDLILHNFNDDPELPEDGTVVCVKAFEGTEDDFELFELEFEEGTEIDPETGELEMVWSGELEPQEEFEKPVNENMFIVDRGAAEILGKALFWDMQVGSDGIQACGTCHFVAGVDHRTKNQLNPNTEAVIPDHTLQVAGPNQDVTADMFPFHEVQNPLLPSEGDPNQVVLRDSNDVMSSMGVSEMTEFVDVLVGADGFHDPFMGVAALKPDVGNPIPEPIEAFIDSEGNKLRRVEPRHTPTMHGAAFFMDVFWDGRARTNFNGGSVFGAADPGFHVHVNSGGSLMPLYSPEEETLEAEVPLEGWTEGEAPIRIKFSGLASQATGPPLSEFEMAFRGRNWQKLGKKLLQEGVTPLANQLVDSTDSRLGAYSNQGGANCDLADTEEGKPGLCISYKDLIELAFEPALWNNVEQHLAGSAVPTDCDHRAEAIEAEEMGLELEADELASECDPFDGYVVEAAVGAADASDTDQFTQMESNFALFFGLGVQLYEELLIPDDTPFDRFFDVNPQAGDGIAQPGERGNLLPEFVPAVTLVEGFGADELFGFDIFMNSNLTKGIQDPEFQAQYPDGRNPNFRSARCGLCHAGPEQTDHSVNVNAGLFQSGAEYEFPIPKGAPEPAGVNRYVQGLFLAEELEEVLQDGVEVENRNMAIIDDPATEWDERNVGRPTGSAFQDNGIYNIGLRPFDEDLSRGGDDPFGWPKSRADLALMNLAGADFEPCQSQTEADAGTCDTAMENFDPEEECFGLFEESGGEPLGNPGCEMEPAFPELPEYMAEFMNNLPAGEGIPHIDELAQAPNHVTEPPVAEFAEIMSQADIGCREWNAELYGEAGVGVPYNEWGPLCANRNSGAPTNWNGPLNGTWPIANRTASNGAFKVPHLRNIELTGPYFHTGSYLTLRQVVDFYVRGGDFPLTNAEFRDPNIVNLTHQAFGFGENAVVDLVNQSPAATPEEQEEMTVALVKFMLALTDERVAHRAAPFDQPEIMVPVDGTAPENSGREALLADARFMQVAATGAEGHEERIQPFLVSSEPTPGEYNDHFDRFGSAAQPNAKVTGRCVGRGCDPKLKIVLRGKGRSKQMVRVGADGSFSIDDVAPGPVKLVAKMNRNRKKGRPRVDFKKVLADVEMGEAISIMLRVSKHGQVKVLSESRNGVKLKSAKRRAGRRGGGGRGR